ncbi:FAD-dependent oxidoreductase [Streptomyces sp. NPDC016566]|uniref:FAD-dependent oxidoreductase n=1 Tax=Streptomyces sp. NPDC016566 TaxID=3364967 RepID=UPI0037033202
MTTEHAQRSQGLAGHVGTSRRRFLTAAVGTAAAGVAAAAAPGTASTAAAATPAADRRVAVLGGGGSGLSAAHELAERGYAVTVHEYYDHLGGKARSMDVPDTGAGGRRPLPGEHGFRFFPGFCRNPPDTMCRIPVPGNANGVHDNLRSGTEALFAHGSGRPDLHFPCDGSPPRPYFADRLPVHLTSCDARREDQWEKTAWWDFIRAGEMSREYQVLLGIGQTRNLVATRAEIASTLPQALGLARAGRCPHRRPRHHRGPAPVGSARPRHERRRRHRPCPQRPHRRGVDRPLGEAPVSLGVEVVLGTQVREEVVYEGGRVSGIRLSARDGGRERTTTADHYVSALPVEHARATWGRALRAADPRLGRCDALRTDWMTGVQFCLRTPTPVVHGHINCLDSPWAVAGIGQAQFWDVRDFARDYGDGQAHDCLSAIGSEWDKPGILYGKTARTCTKEETVTELWAQLKDGVNDSGRARLRDEDRLGGSWTPR